MKRVFVSGAVTPTGSGNHALEFLENIRKGIRVTIELLSSGYAVYCPFTDFQYWLCMQDGEFINPETIYEADKAMLEVMDAILLLPGSENSHGVFGELTLAIRLGIPIFHSIEQLKKGLK